MAITLEEFEDLIFTYARSHGQPFIGWTERAKLRAFVNRHLQRINEEKKLVYDDNVTFATTSSDSGVYEFIPSTDTYYSVRRAVYVQLLEPEIVLVEGAALIDFEGMPGLISVDEGNRQFYDYRTVADAQPQRAMLLTGALRLIPAPDAAYDVTVCGWIRHFDLTADGTADTAELWIEDGAADPLAMAIAGELISVGSEGQTTQVGIGLAERGMAKLTKAASRAASLIQGQQVRRKRGASRYSLA